MCSSLQFSCSVVKKAAFLHPEHLPSNTIGATQYRVNKKSFRSSEDQVTGKMDLLQQLLVCGNSTSAFATQVIAVVEHEAIKEANLEYVLGVKIPTWIILRTAWRAAGVISCIAC